MTLFLFILFSGFLGLIGKASHNQPHRSAAILAVAVFLANGHDFLGFVKNGTRSLLLFWVSSAPLALRSLLL
jgi:F-type H+-transporting ATPase subunit a